MKIPRAVQVDCGGVVPKRTIILLATVLHFENGQLSL